MDNSIIKQKIDSFPRWHYQFDLNGILTPIADKRRINRHEQRKRYFFDPLLEICGGSLQGKRVLDLGCNAGFWSLNAIENECDFVLGVDGREMHVDQANFVFQCKSIDTRRYKFIQANIFDLKLMQPGKFDIVFLFGLMYHISKPVELFEIISQINTDILLIDTSLSHAPGSYLEIQHEPLDEPRNAVDYELVMYPTKKAVLDLVEQFGYTGIVLRPCFTDYTASRDYEVGLRRAFLCVKDSSLTALSHRSEIINFRSQAVDFTRWTTRKLANMVRR